nr:Scr1 family TA system antitoxin-like transcriptional regulator [Streptomyces sp. CB09001]
MSGLLPTERYARTLMENRYPPRDEEVVEQRIDARLERQATLTRRKPPAGLSFVVYEAVLRRPMSSTPSPASPRSPTATPRPPPTTWATSERRPPARAGNAFTWSARERAGGAGRRAPRRAGGLRSLTCERVMHGTFPSDPRPPGHEPPRTVGGPESHHAIPQGRNPDAR